MTGFAELKKLPLRFVAGDRWAWSRPDLASLYPIADFTLTLHARHEREPQSRWSAASSGADHDFALTPAQTQRVRPGAYAWTLVALRTADGARETLENGRIEIAPDPATSTADPRSELRQLRDALLERMAGISRREHQSYSIEGVSVAAMPLSDVAAAIDRVNMWLEAEEAREALAAGRMPGSQILARY